MHKKKNANFPNEVQLTVHKSQEDSRIHLLKLGKDQNECLFLGNASFFSFED